MTTQARSNHPDWLVPFLDVLGTALDHAEPAGADDRTRRSATIEPAGRPD